MITKKNLVILGCEWVTKPGIQVADATKDAEFFFSMRWKNKSPNKV